MLVEYEYAVTIDYYYSLHSYSTENGRHVILNGVDQFTVIWPQGPQAISPYVVGIRNPENQSEIP